MFEERKNLLTSMSAPGKRGFSPSASERARQSQVHIERIRAMLMSNDKASNDAARKNGSRRTDQSFETGDHVE